MWDTNLSDTDLRFFRSRYSQWNIPSNHLENVLKTCLEGVLKTCPEDVLKICLKDVFKTSWRHVLKTSSRRPQDHQMFAGRFQHKNISKFFKLHNLVCISLCVHVLLFLDQISHDSQKSSKQLLSWKLDKGCKK